MKTLKSFIEVSCLPESVIRAVVKNMHGWTEFQNDAEDIVNYGADSGFGKFVYHVDTCKFYADNQAEIQDMIHEMAKDFGTTPIELVQGFNCLKNGIILKEIGETLYGLPKQHDTQVANALAWYALEEVARSYVDFMGL
jgi:hypothetical protein